MPKSKITIEKRENNFIIKKDNYYELFFSMSILFYHRIIEVIKQDSGMNVAMNPKFEVLLTKLSLENEVLIIEENELKLLADWVDCLCLIMLDIDNLNLKNKDIKKYLRLCESLLSVSKKLLKNKQK